MRAVVVGASSGLGRSIATGLGQAGEKVALLARRHDRLVDAAEEAGPGSLAIRCDVTDEASCRRAIEEAAEGLGGIDGLLYATGIGPLARMVDVDAATWRRTFDTNVTGASLITAAALPHLAESKGVAAYLSSISASMTPPWPGLGAYAVSKAALDTMVEAWRSEHPEIGFTRIVVGDCAGGEGPSGTEFINQWDLELAAELHPIWTRRQYLSGSLLDVKELVRIVDTVLQGDSVTCIPSIAIVPRPGQGPPPPSL
ncbi:MAG TPA: SDR family oxidoreductase [Acidimicrobiales bacterium]|nr:SDR family oxidoreductase [Acidimicrobiales bacterium]